MEHVVAAVEKGDAQAVYGILQHDCEGDLVNDVSLALSEESPEQNWIRFILMIRDWPQLSKDNKAAFFETFFQDAVNGESAGLVDLVMTIAEKSGLKPDFELDERLVSHLMCTGPKQTGDDIIRVFLKHGADPGEAWSAVQARVAGTNRSWEIHVKTLRAELAQAILEKEAVARNSVAFLESAQKRAAELQALSTVIQQAPAPATAFKPVTM